MSYSNKLPDAVDAGAYYLTNKEFFEYGLARRLGIALPIEKHTIATPEFWAEIKERFKNRKNDFAKARQLWGGASQIPRLEVFYQRLLAELH